MTGSVFFNRVAVFIAIFQKPKNNLYDILFLYVNRPRSFAKPLNKLFHILAYALILEIVNIVTAVQLYQPAV